MLETSFALSIVSVREGMRRVSPLREFLSCLFFFVCVCVCVHAQRHREREGGREKHKRRSWKDTTQQMQEPLRDLLAQRGGRKEERERERERERVEERSTPFTALHMWTCVSREQREQGVHTTLLTHSLTHSLPLSPLSPISSARERECERGRDQERERRKEKDTCKDLFFAMSFFLHSLSH